jgi:predicted kinase
MDNKRPTLLCLKGLPASGKTTYALELVKQGGWARANKDDIRKAFFPDYTKRDENQVIYMEDADIESELRDGMNVVVDDTNFHPKHQPRLEQLAKDAGADFEIMYIDTPLEECIRRNNKRDKDVPTETIINMYDKYIAPLTEEHVEYDDKLEEAIIVDVDGTLAHICGRDIYDASKAMGDTCDDAVSSIVSMAYGHGYKVIILTGRHTGHLEVTKEWLDLNGINYDEIYCRNQYDIRPDYVVKKELFDANIRGKYNVKYVIDDRPSVCRMWRSLGLKTLQVGNPHKEF